MAQGLSPEDRLRLETLFQQAAELPHSEHEFVFGTLRTSIKSECLDKMIVVGESSLLRALDQFCSHYRGERPHQGIGNEIIDRQPTGSVGEVRAHERLGGLLKYYLRSAA